MELFLKQIMLEKDKYLKNNSLNIFFKTIIFLLFSNCVFADSISEKERIITYIDNLINFSANFIQSDGISVEEGILYISEKRIRADYLSPSKITIILDNNKAMFVNHDLEEVQYFNPKNSPAGVFLDIFKNNILLYESALKIENQNIILKKNSETNGESYILSVLFEKNPYILRKINLNYNDFNFILSLNNHSYNISFEKNFFSMANPFLKN